MNSLERVESKRRAKSKPARKRWDTLTDWARDRAGIITMPIARVIGRMGIHPNVLTILGMAFQIGIAVLFSFGRIHIGGVLLLILSPIDALDGALARATGKQSRFGAFLDSTLDRVSDAVLIIGLIIHHLRQDTPLPAFLFLISLATVMIVSYVRTRAEALKFTCKVGVLTRMERVIMIGILSALGLTVPLAWLLSILSVFTVLQRILHVYAISQEDSGE
ncbi:MAG TPA: CDP-alcohol phosphatidyltransferase family protein [Chloroflexi bacterium]|nr:CDP-alcohol phosphatidyltransferase family protein [Chloroflexota bacterium]